MTLTALYRLRNFNSSSSSLAKGVQPWVIGVSVTGGSVVLPTRDWITSEADFLVPPFPFP